MEAVVVENERLRLVTVPDLGARIVSLADRATGREWLVQGEPPVDPMAWAGPDAVFGGAQAYGWDECLPTVARCPDPLDPWGPSVRDHGDGWGRPGDVRVHRDGSMVAGWRVPARYLFRRTLRLDGPTVLLEYSVESLGPDLPFLWSMHPLLALEPGARIELPGVGHLGLTRAVGLDLKTVEGRLGWPMALTADGSTVDLSLVRDVSARIALKLAGDAPPDGSVLVRQPDGSTLVMDWHPRSAPALGVWLDFGGWPAGAGRHQVALEPATSPDEDLASAVASGRAVILRGRGARASWTVRLSVDEPRGGEWSR